MQLFQVMLTDPPRSGKRKPIISMYVVVAADREQALARFKEEMPAQIAEATKVSIAPTGSLVARTF